MDTIIADIFFGNLKPVENLYPKDPEYTELNANINNGKAVLKNIISEEAQCKLEKLESLYSRSSEMQSVEAFTRGFKIGVRLIAEVYRTKEDSDEIDLVKSLKA